MTASLHHITALVEKVEKPETLDNHETQLTHGSFGARTSVVLLVRRHNQDQKSLKLDDGMCVWV